MSGQDSGGIHPDPLDPGFVAPSDAGSTSWTRLVAGSAAATAFHDALTLGGGSVRDGVIDDLVTYYEIEPADVVRRCLRWEEWSTAEWFEAPRDDDDAIKDFYRTTVSWSFDLLWYAYLQAEGHRYPVSSVIAYVVEHELGPDARVLDFGGGVGVTGQMFHRLGHRVDVADIASGILGFTKYRLDRRGDHPTLIDLNDAALTSDSYDVVTAIDVLVHIPDLERTLRDLHGAMRPGGLLFANVTARPNTPQNAQFLYDDDLPVRRLIHRVGFEPVARFDGMITMYRRVDPVGWAHARRVARDVVALSRLRPVAARAVRRVDQFVWRARRQA